MDDSDQTSRDLRHDPDPMLADTPVVGDVSGRADTPRSSHRSAEVLITHFDVVALSASMMGNARPSRDVEMHPRDLDAALAALGRLFNTVETLQLRCSVLEAEKTHRQQTSDAMLASAFEKIENLEEVVAGLMRLVSKYDSLLRESNGRIRDAEDRATQAEFRAKSTERGASDAVEWLYRYMTDSFEPPR